MFTNKTPWIILLVLWMIGSTWWHVCSIKQLCFENTSSLVTNTSSAPEGEEPEIGTTPPGADAFPIVDGNRFRLELPGNFSFAKSGANANLNALGGKLESLATYLKKNPERSLDITGYYTPAETNTTTFSNLGLARAEGMKQYFIQQGVSARTITTKGVERNLPVNARGDSLRGGLYFTFNGTDAPVATEPKAATTETPATTTELVKLTEPTTEKELARKEKFTSVFKPMDLYFPLSEANYIKTDETTKFFDEATKYLADHKDKKLLLTGHTDNSGPDQVNMQLSLDRANDVKVKLRKSGINVDQIVVKAKGESEPKADNSTISGRKANRRVTVVVME